MADKRRTRLREFIAAVKDDPDALAAATKAAMDAREAIERMVVAVGASTTADYLAEFASTLRGVQRILARQRQSPVPATTGRKARDWLGDARLKLILLRPPRGPNGKRLSIAMLARWEKALNPRWRMTSAGGVRQHLTRLKREALAEAARPWHPILMGTHPNKLMALAGFDAPQSETLRDENPRGICRATRADP